jgi:hypothetical protein
MMKWLKYELYQATLENGEDVTITKETPWSEINEETAKIEAWGGAYEIYDDGTPEPASEPSQLDRVESQVAYLAMMAGYPEILEV